MKMSKLRYVFAFLLVAVISLATVNVSAATTRLKLSQLNMSDIISTIAYRQYDREVQMFDSNVAIGEMNPVRLYTYLDSVKGLARKAYAYDYRNVSVSTGSTGEVTDLSIGYTDIDVKIGLALTYGMGVLDAGTLADQTALNSDQLNLSMATQAYIWAVSGKVDSATIRAALNPYAQDYYDALVSNVDRALTLPSFAYATAEEAKAHPIQMMWNPENARYEATVTDVNFSYADNVIPQIGSGIEYYKSGVDSIVYYTTQQVGSAADPVVLGVNKSTSMATYPGYATTMDPNSDPQQIVTKSGVAIAPTTSYVSFYTNALRVKVTKTLGTANGNGNTRTGDATAVGAVYGIYSDEGCNTLVERVVTDKDGVALSSPLELKDYWVKEITNPEGTTIDGTKYKAEVAKATIEPNGQRVSEVKSTNQVIYGGFCFILSTSDLSGETTKPPSKNSKIALTLKSDPSQQYIEYTDNEGYVEFLNIPYGDYICTELEKENPEVDYMDPINIFIKENKKYTYTGLVNEDVAQRWVKIVKVDADSKLPVIKDSAKFEVRDEDGNVVSGKIQNPEPQVLQFFTTTEEGHVYLPQKLPYGTYKVYELDAPDGYYNEGAALNKEVATFKVDTNTPEHPETKDDVVVTIENQAQKVMLQITTRGQVPTLNNIPVNVEGRQVYRPSYRQDTIPGVEYKITALEDIVTGDGVVHMAKGDTKILNSGEKQELYLGKYQIEQVSVPQGYVLNKEIQTLDLTYTNQKEKIQEKLVTFNIEKQTYNVDVKKEFKNLNFYKRNPDGTVTSIADYSSVVIGIYAAEDIKNVLGETVITAGTLVDITRLDSEGKAAFGSMLPTGKFYAQELETNINYAVSDAHYPVDAIPENNEDLTFMIDIGTIVNEPRNETTFKLVKVEKVDTATQTNTIADYAEMMLIGASEGLGSTELDRTVEATTLEGAKFGIYYTEGGKDLPLLEIVDGEYVDVVRTTDENGEIVIEGLPFGEYIVKELEAPRYYELNTEEFLVNFTAEDPEPDELVVQDERTMIDYKVTVTDEDKEVVEGAVVELVDPETNKVVYTLETNEEGVADFGSIRAGRYVRKITPPECYVTPEDKEVYIEDKAGVEQNVTVKYVTGNILIYKTDAETSEPLPGCTFQVLDYDTGDLIVEVESGDDGYVEVRGLRYGKYIVVETAAPENYEISEDQYEVSIVKDGETVTVAFANVPTGDIAVAAYVLVAMISLFAIVKTSKKLRKN